MIRSEVSARRDRLAPTRSIPLRLARGLGAVEPEQLSLLGPVKGEGTAQPIENIDWNAGAQYSFDIDGHTYMLVAEADYSSSTVYDLGEGKSYEPVIRAQGWATRLFRLR